jgi:phosphohistidine phosphatase
MRRLMLLRHAKSDWSAAGTPDHERTLAPRGRKAAPSMGRHMAKHKLIPDHAIVSSARRTRETWELLKEALPGEPPAAFEDSLYEATPGDIIATIARAPRQAHALLVIGHNPGLQLAALTLAGDGAPELRRSLAEKFPTAALAVIDFDIADWSAIAPGSGTLTHFATPRRIRNAS